MSARTWLARREGLAGEVGEGLVVFGLQLEEPVLLEDLGRWASGNRGEPLSGGAEVVGEEGADHRGLETDAILVAAVECCAVEEAPPRFCGRTIRRRRRGRPWPSPDRLGEVPRVLAILGTDLVAIFFECLLGGLAGELAEEHALELLVDHCGQAEGIDFVEEPRPTLSGDISMTRC